MHDNTKPAFPLMPTQELWERVTTIELGMNLREYYAGQALAGANIADWTDNRLLAIACVEAADELIEELKRDPKEKLNHNLENNYE